MAGTQGQWAKPGVQAKVTPPLPAYLILALIYSLSKSGVKETLLRVNKGLAAGGPV